MKLSRITLGSLLAFGLYAGMAVPARADHFSHRPDFCHLHHPGAHGQQHHGLFHRYQGRHRPGGDRDPHDGYLHRYRGPDHRAHRDQDMHSGNRYHAPWRTAGSRDHDEVHGHAPDRRGQSGTRG